MTVENVQVAIIFNLDNQIVFTLGEKLKQAQKGYNANLQLLNVPAGALPEAPRRLFLTPTFNLYIGLNRMDVFISIPDHIKSNIDACLDYCYNTTIGLAEILLRGAIKYNWCGVITTLNYPDKDKIRPSLKVVEKLLPYITKIDTKGRELATLNLQIGFKEPPFFKNITFSGYDRFQIQFLANQNTIPQQIKMEDTDVIESGVSVLVDINNIPQEQKGTFEGDFSSVVEKSKDSSKSILGELNLGGVLNA
jgi:hypothetical protein